MPSGERHMPTFGEQPGGHSPYPKPNILAAVNWLAPDWLSDPLCRHPDVETFSGHTNTIALIASRGMRMLTQILV